MDNGSLHLHSFCRIFAPMRRAWIPAILLLLLSSCSKDADRSGLIAYQSSRDGNFEIYVMNQDGSGQRRVTSSPSNDITPSLSPEDTAILFASDRSGNWEIYSMMPPYSLVRRLTHDDGLDGERLDDVRVGDLEDLPTVQGAVFQKLFDTAGDFLKIHSYQPFRQMKRDFLIRPVASPSGPPALPNS